nr:immunoglobulin heavy chain junction region [Macaca mulatta]MOV39927.1 immunoglobulin heavy chain junction region [Macaca mulatta]MOV43688.1 immunoglobulin heavy chain junction region [Macaca mulatta]
CATDQSGSFNFDFW